MTASGAMADYWRAFGTTPEALLACAGEFARRAYAPYSGFPVGAAILAEDGRMFGGCNVENASFGMTICAERVAMSSAVAAGCRKPLAIAVLSLRAEFCPPCGACRQFLAEFNPHMDVLLSGNGSMRFHRLGALLPERFDLERARDG